MKPKSACEKIRNSGKDFPPRIIVFMLIRFEHTTPKG